MSSLKPKVSNKDNLQNSPEKSLTPAPLKAAKNAVFHVLDPKKGGQN